MAKEMQLNLDIVDNLNGANLFVTSKSHYRRKPQKVRDAEAANLPIYVLKSNTPSQIRQFLNTIYPTDRAWKRQTGLKLPSARQKKPLQGKEWAGDSGTQPPERLYPPPTAPDRRKKRPSSQSSGKDPREG